MRCVDDNSSGNPFNPNDPPRRVVAGNRSSDEMAHLWLQVLPHAPRDGAFDPRKLLQEAMARHNLEKNPSDFEARYNLAAMLQARGAQAEAIQNFELAVGLHPQHPTPNNALCASLLASGRITEATQHLYTAPRAQP